MHLLERVGNSFHARPLFRVRNLPGGEVRVENTAEEREGLCSRHIGFYFYSPLRTVMVELMAMCGKFAETTGVSMSQLAKGSMSRNLDQLSQASVMSALLLDRSFASDPICRPPRSRREHSWPASVAALLLVAWRRRLIDGPALLASSAAPRQSSIEPRYLPSSDLGCVMRPPRRLRRPGTIVR